ncbi:hypothetical protein SV7mr_45950 [Stieleria bergensis]|uniref:Uncharacterized protein n=1 Tax=Stieleria bergensis TaxID=2528025 RepID=A0A517T113_9BACT|nr:hypothetical protein SV7mr_45950 [Planctomycetes bacterium SV_7m_r]
MNNANGQQESVRSAAKNFSDSGLIDCENRIGACKHAPSNGLNQQALS